VAESFIPLMIYNDKDPETMQKYGVRAFPTFVITDKKGEEEMRQVGAPFSTPAAAREWFPKVVNALDNLPKYEAAHEADADDVDAALKLAEVYGALGRGQDALKLYDSTVGKLEKDDERYVDVRLAQADAMMGTMTRANQRQVGAKMGEIYDEILPGLVEAKDERAVKPGILNARIKVMVGSKHAEGRTELKNLAKAFPEHDSIWEIRFFAAVFALQAGENDTAKEEFKSLIADAEKAEVENDYTKAAQQQLDRMG
jgi:thioredoxin-like negative regulator of GroEL